MIIYLKFSAAEDVMKKYPRVFCVTKLDSFNSVSIFLLREPKIYLPQLELHPRKFGFSGGAPRSSYGTGDGLELHSG